MSANDRQEGGLHYKRMEIEVWDFVARNNIPYLEGNAIKYLSRWREKGGIEDLKKALHYVEKAIEIAREREAQDGFLFEDDSIYEDDWAADIMTRERGREMLGRLSKAIETGNRRRLGQIENFFACLEIEDAELQKTT